MSEEAPDDSPRPEYPRSSTDRWPRFQRWASANLAAVAALISAFAALLGVAATILAFLATTDQARESQLADRYTRAVAQLGDPAPDVRIGGIYALQRLGIDSPRDKPTVTAVLAAYVRNHLPFADSACLALDAEARRTGFPPLLSSDVVTALDVLSQPHSDERTVASLVGVCLPGSNVLRGRDLTRFDLSYANLDDATLVGTNLVDDPLVGADLERSDLGGAALTGANIERAHLAGAENVDLSGTIGRPAELPTDR